MRLNRATGALVILIAVVVALLVVYARHEPNSAFISAEQPQVPRQYDVFLIAGQSNAYFGLTRDPNIDVSGGRVFQWLQSGLVAAADEPLDYPVAQFPWRIGFAVAFARDYYATQRLSPDRAVLLIPAAVAATGFQQRQWNPGDVLFDNAVRRTNVALAANPGSRLVGILWQQGEEDVTDHMTGADYAAHLDAMIAAMRAQITGAADVPFLLGGMAPAWMATPGAAEIEKAIATTPSRVSLTAFVDPVGLKSNISEQIHFSAASQRIIAGRYWAAFAALK